MDAKTLEALKASIKKWEKNANTARVALANDALIERGPRPAKGVIGTGSIGCPLCTLFARGPQACSGCPVKDATGMIGCEGTPYTQVYDMMDGGMVRSSAELIAACKAEVAFLRSLLPAEG